MTAQFLNAHRATRLLRRTADGNTVTSMFEFDVVDDLNDALELGERVSNLLWHTPCARALTVL